MARIQEYINNNHKYKVDHTYQRRENVWSIADKQCLIDTILRVEPMPLFFLNEKSKEGIYYIVDGQQRLNTIWEFYKNNIRLHRKFSGKENHGKTFGGKNPISDKQREHFLNYQLNFRILEDYDDERVRLIFSRLQRGKPLSLGERLNAKPGKIVLRMREIAQHPFMNKSIGVSKGRYGVYPDAARILFYEIFGAKQCGSDELYDFFEKYPDISKKSKEYKNIISVLNFLTKCFPPDPGDYKYLAKHVWVFGTHTMVHYLKKNFSLNGKEKLIRRFIERFHFKIYDEDSRRSRYNYQKFYDHVRGGWSEKLITLRRNILVEEFLIKHELGELDEKRQISDEMKIAAYGRHPTCEECGRSFKDYKEAEYHHKVRHVDGGKSEVANIMVICKECHKRIHGKEEIEISPDEEEYEIEDEEEYENDEENYEIDNKKE